MTHRSSRFGCYTSCPGTSFLTRSWNEVGSKWSNQSQASHPFPQGNRLPGQAEPGLDPGQNSLAPTAQVGSVDAEWSKVGSSWEMLVSVLAGDISHAMEGLNPSLLTSMEMLLLTSGCLDPRLRSAPLAQAPICQGWKGPSCAHGAVEGLLQRWSVQRTQRAPSPSMLQLGFSLCPM